MLTNSVRIHAEKFPLFPAEGRTFLRILRNLKACVWSFFDGFVKVFWRFLYWPYFSIGEELWTITVSKMQLWRANLLISMLESFELGLWVYALVSMEYIFSIGSMKYSLNFVRIRIRFTKRTTTGTRLWGIRILLIRLTALYVIDAKDFART